MATLAFKTSGDAIILIGGHGSHMGQSAYLRDTLGREDGPPPPVDLALEKKHGDFVRSMIRSDQTTAVHDISDGGLVMALTDMALASNLGAKIQIPREADAHITLFGEDQARYIITCKPEKTSELLRHAETAGVPAVKIGTVTPSALIIEGHATISLNMLRTAHEDWLPDYMETA